MQKKTKKEEETESNSNKKKNNGTFGRIIPKARDSVYNFTDDINLAKYRVEDAPYAKIMDILRLVGIVSIFAIFVYFIYFIFSFVNPPEYKLIVADEFITDKNAEIYENKELLSFKENGEVYIRFQWDSSLPTDYLRVAVYRVDSKQKREEGIFGRSVPTDKSFIYFMGYFDKGSYLVETRTRSGKLLKKRNFRIQ